MRWPSAKVQQPSGRVCAAYADVRRRALGCRAKCPLDIAKKAVGVFNDVARGRRDDEDASGGHAVRLDRLGDDRSDEIEVAKLTAGVDHRPRDRSVRDSSDNRGLRHTRRAFDHDVLSALSLSGVRREHVHVARPGYGAKAVVMQRRKPGHDGPLSGVLDCTHEPLMPRGLSGMRHDDAGQQPRPRATVAGAVGDGRSRHSETDELGVAGDSVVPLEERIDSGRVEGSKTRHDGSMHR